MKNKYLKFIIEFLIIFIILLLFSYIFTIIKDEFYAFGFSYNIANHKFPYKDFNMVVGPFYNLLMAIPLFIKNKYLLFMLTHIFFYSTIFTIVYEKYGIKKFSILLISFLIGETLYTYNNFCTFLILMILLLIDSKYKYRIPIIGILIGLILVTKHNIGGVLAIIYFFSGKDKLKRIICCSTPFFLLALYLLITNSLFEYLDLCIFGAGNFLNNFMIEPIVILIMIPMIGYLIYKYYKTKDIKILYILGSYILIFPILDYNHILWCVPLFVYYLISEKNNRYIKICLTVFIVIILLLKVGEAVYYKTIFVTDSNPFKYMTMSKEIYDKGMDTKKLYNEYKDYDIYIFGIYTYASKLQMNSTLDFYDLINKGNLGKNEDKYINDIINKCTNKKCLFLLDITMYPKDNEYTSSNLLFKNVVEDNYNYIGQTPYYVIFSNQ